MGQAPMNHGYSLLGFIAIVILYIFIGLLAAAGAIFMGRKIFTPKTEQVVYAISLIIIGLAYVAFTAYFGVTSAWGLELAAVAAFAALGLVGARVPWALIVGYPLHGAWDLLHELQAHGVHSGFDAGQLTLIPLAYGFFCAAFDFSMGAYFYTRRVAWSAAWKTV
jgi:hypothetical protein